MEVLKKTTEIQKVVETIVLDGDNIYIVKDFYDTEKDKIIDTIMSSKDGHIIEDPAEYEAVIEFLESLELDK